MEKKEDIQIKLISPEGVSQEPKSSSKKKSLIHIARTIDRTRLTVPAFQYGVIQIPTVVTYIEIDLGDFDESEEDNVSSSNRSCSSLGQPTAECYVEDSDLDLPNLIKGNDE